MLVLDFRDTISKNREDGQRFFVYIFIHNHTIYSQFIIYIYIKFTRFFLSTHLQNYFDLASSCIIIADLELHSETIKRNIMKKREEKLYQR